MRCFARLYHFYCRRILPVIGGMISGIARRVHLPAGVGTQVPVAEELAEQMRTRRFRGRTFRAGLTGGIVALHLGRVPSPWTGSGIC